jgi:hypothetical protein
MNSPLGGAIDSTSTHFSRKGSLTEVQLSICQSHPIAFGAKYPFPIQTDSKYLTRKEEKQVQYLRKW